MVDSTCTGYNYIPAIPRDTVARHRIAGSRETKNTSQSVRTGAADGSDGAK